MLSDAKHLRKVPYDLASHQRPASHGWLFNKTRLISRNGLFLSQPLIQDHPTSQNMNILVGPIYSAHEPHSRYIAPVSQENVQEHFTMKPPDKHKINSKCSKSHETQ